MCRSAFARMCALVTVVGVLTLGIGATSANAALTLGLPGLLGSGPTAPAPVAPTTSLTGLLTQTTGAVGSLLTNQIGLGTTAETVACPVATSLATLPPPGTPGVSQSVFFACILHFLDFEWRTTHPGPPAPLMDNNVVTTLGVPTPLNLDSDALPEALGVVLPLAPNKFQLSLTRIDLGLKGDLPSSAELVITDPTGGSLPRSHIGVGLSSYGGRFPDNLSITFTLESYTAPIGFSGPPRFRVDINATRQAKRAAVTADLFDEDATSTVRDSFVRAEVGMKPVPSTLSADVATRTDDGIDADVQTSNTQTLLSLPGLLNVNFGLGPEVGPPTVDAHVAIRQRPDTAGNRRIQRLSATLTDLPGSMGLRYRPIKPSTPTSSTPEAIDKARGGQTIDYSASSTLNKLEVAYDDVVQPPGTAPEKPSLRAHLKATSIPPGIGVSQLGSFTSFNAIDDGIGSVEGEFALNGDLVQRRTDRPGLRYVKPKVAAGQPQPLAIAARIDGLRRASFDNLGGRAVADVGIKEQPFDVDLRDEVSGLTATANIEDLPANAHIEYLPAQPASDETGGTPKPLRFRYDAGDHSIALIDFKAAFDQTIGGHLDQIEGKITDLPPVIDVDADLQGNVYEFNASKPFGEIEALARNKKAVADGTVPALSDGVTGVSGILKDDGTFAAKARVIGLKNVRADLGLNKYHVEAGAVPLEVRALVDEVRGSGSTREVLPRTLLGTIDRLPDRIDLSFDEEGDQEKVITYDASAPIGAISLELDGPKLYAPEPKVNKVRATAFDVPSTFTARLGNAGKLDLDAGPGIGGMEALVTSGPDPEFAPDRHAAYVEHGKNVVVKARLLGFKHFKLDPDPIDVVLETQRALPLDVDAKLDLVEDPDETPESEAHLRVSNVPAKIAAHYERDGQIHYEADDGAATGRIDFIHADGTFYETRGADHLRRDVSASVEGVPSLIDLALGLDDPDHKTIAYDANGKTDRVAAEVRGDALYADQPKVNRVAAEVLGIPTHLAATLGTGGAFEFDGGDGIDKITALVTSGPDPELDPGRHEAYAETGDNVVGKAQLLGFKHFKLASDPIDVTFDTAEAKPLHIGAKLDLVGDDGDPESQATLDVQDVPAHVHATFDGSDGGGALHYDASQRIDHIAAAAKAFETRGDDHLERNLTASLDGIPTTLDLALDGLDGGTKQVTYDADGKVDHIGLGLTGDKLYADEPRIDTVAASVDGIPAHLAATLGDDGAVDIDGGDGIDKITALVSDGADPALPADKHAADVQDNGDGVHAKVQLLGFKHFTLDPDPIKAVLETAQSKALAVKADVDEKRGSETLNRVGTLDISPVPSKVTVEVKEPSAGTKTIHYDASSKIDKIDLTLNGPKLYADQPKINRLEAHVAGIPSTLDATIGSDTHLDFDAGAGIDAIEALATSGPDPAVPEGKHFAYAETGENVVAKARLLGFKRFALIPDPLDVTFQTDTDHPLEAVAKLDWDGDGTAELDGAASIVNVPASMHFRAEGDGSYSYAGSSRISSIDLDATGLPDVPQLPAKIAHAHVKITDVPQYLEGGYGSTGRIHFKGTTGTATDPLSAVGSIDATAETADPPALPTGLAANNVAYRQTGAEAAAHLHVSGLREADVTTTPLDALVDTDVLQALDVDAAQDADGDGDAEKTLTAKLRSNITRVHVQDELAASGHQIVADTGSALGSLDVALKADNLPMGIKKATLHLEDLPEYIRVAFPSSSDVIDVDLLRRDADGNLVADGRGLDLLEASINDGAPRSTVVDHTGATVSSDGVYVDLDDGDITTAGLRLHGLRGITYGTSPHTAIGIDVAQSQAKPVAFDAYLDDKHAVGQIDKLPENMLLELSPKSDEPIRYHGDQRIDQIKVDTNYAKDFGIPSAQVEIDDAPTNFAVCFRTDGHRASCMPSNQFDAATDKKISAAYESDVDNTATRPTVKIHGCFATPCSSGSQLDATVKVARRLELEAGASASGPSVRNFDCFDETTTITNVFGQIGCMLAFPANAISDALNSAKVHAFVWFDTGNQDLDGTASYSIPSPVSFLDQPITFTLNAPTLKADQASMDVNLSFATLGSPFTPGGTISCTGGSLSVGTHFHQSLGSIDIPDGLRDFVNGFVDAYNALAPDDAELAHVQDPLSLGSIDGPINLNLISRFC